MQFETTCPNEHVIRFPLELAGRTGHCPKCSARFTIPTLNEIRESLGEDMDEETEAAFLEVERKRKEKIQQRAAAKKAKMEEMMRLSASKEAREEKKEVDFSAFTEKAKEDAPENSEKKEPLFAPTQEDTDADSEDSHEDSGEMIQFMCPNGHILSAAADQAGKAGICPECQAKFLVPDFDEDEEEGEEKEELAPPAPPTPPKQDDFSLKLDLELDVKKEDVAPSLSDSRKITRSPSGSDAPAAFLYPGIAVKEDGQVDIGLEEVSSQIPEALRVDPMAKIFWNLWNEFGKIRKLELHTADGKVYFPVEFHESKSLSSVGYFEIQEENETLTAILRWDNIVRILIRN
ncbi:MAG: hypothetical protein Q4D62_07210 [Planctomycetia bacterium]|nr:hypothetical protein [Planctomycetia bacterium]